MGTGGGGWGSLSALGASEGASCMSIDDFMKFSKVVGCSRSHDPRAEVGCTSSLQRRSD